MIASWAAAAGDAELAEIIGKFDPKRPEQALIAWLSGQVPEQVGKVLEAISQEKWIALVGLIIGNLIPGLDADLITSLASGTLREEAIKRLTDYLKQQGADHAGDIATAVMDMVTGARSLFAEGPEEDAAAFLNTPQRVALWRECREVIYMTQLACSGEAIVSGDPQARPHVFRAAAIRFTTPLDKIVPAKADQKYREVLCNTLTAFLDVHFGKRMRSFNSDGVLVVAASEFVPQASGHIADCSVIYDKVNGRLVNPV
jgi:hypothetical protein